MAILYWIIQLKSLFLGGEGFLAFGSDGGLIRTDAYAKEPSAEDNMDSFFVWLEKRRATAQEN
jgi:hypothetical protein